MSLMLSDNLAPQPITDVFTDDTNIDRRKCHRTVPMKVLALGVGRTGTACESNVGADHANLIRPPPTVYNFMNALI